ncbi:MAG: hypothetical protein HYT82_00480 [Candidatus Harrisonbacteria bacterium]|nr:hypothetical protein [Candidatus Harrisonbacteria bacterium]MBI2604147.1 hypothetical protein [Candidatus Harrisonbacteria bacterium]
MARIFDVSAHTVAVLDVTDTALRECAPDELLLVDVTTREGKVMRELLHKRTARSLWRAFRRATKAVPPEEGAAALFGGATISYRDVTDIGMLGPWMMTNLGNGGFSFYAPSRRVVWSTWGELVRGIARDLTLDGKASLRATEFALIIGDGLDGRTVTQWFLHSRISSQQFAEQFRRIRACIDAIRLNWVLAGRHPWVWQFVRGNLSETKTPVLDLLKTEEGAAEVMDYITATADPAFLCKNASR